MCNRNPKSLRRQLVLEYMVGKRPGRKQSINCETLFTNGQIISSTLSHLVIPVEHRVYLFIYLNIRFIWILTRILYINHVILTYNTDNYN